MTEQIDTSSLGRWETDFRFVFEPPLSLPQGSVPPVITAFDVTPLADHVKDLRDRRAAMLSDFVWRIALDLPGCLR